ncbi:MAG: hypothetical protein ACYTGV_01760 [Planctomycetota bacterium]|jgi:hypothetical protein
MDLTSDPQLALPAGLRRFRPLGRLAALAGIVAALAACTSSDDGPGPFDELLFVTDTLSVTSYSVSNGTPTARDTALIPGIPGTYSRTGTLVTITIENHSVPDGYRVDLDFSPGVGGSAADGIYIATYVDDETFTVETPDHGLGNGDVVTLLYTSGAAVDGEFVVDLVPDADTFSVIADAPLNTSGNVQVVIGADYTIFGMAMHPNGRWLYVTSTYAYDSRRYQWGSDLISRFAINWDTGNLTFEKSFRTAEDLPTEDSAPVTLVFSADGTRLVHQDDELDGLRMWDVDVLTGDITLIANSGRGTTGQHGIVWSADGSRVYHGTSVFTVGANSLTRTTSGDAGESNQIVNGTMFAIMDGSRGPIRAYSLADPDLPAEIATSPDTPHHARDLAVLDGGALIVSSGFGGVKSYDYNGATIVPSVGAGDTEFRDGGMPWPPSGPGEDLLRIYRTISANAAENLVAAAYFTNHPDAGIGGFPSGFVLLEVAADGSLTLLGDYTGGNYARVARFYQKP